MRNSTLLFIPLFAIAATPAASQPDAPVLTLNCYNPPLTVSFQDYGLTPDGQGRAHSEQVQFNVDMPGTAGSTIFVDVNNDGVCTATIGGAHLITSAHVKITKEFVFGAEGLILKTGSVYGIRQPNLTGPSSSVSFSVFKPKTAKTYGANVTLALEITYQ